MKMRSFQKRFTGTLLTLVLPLLCFGFLALSISYHFVSSSARLNTTSQMTQAKNSIELILNEMDMFVINFSASPELTTYLKDFQRGKFPTSEVLTTKNIIRLFLSTPVYAKPYLYSTYVYCDIPDARFVLSSEGLVSLTHFYDSDALDDLLRLTQGHSISTQRRVLRGQDDVITVCYRVMRDEIIVLNIRANHLEEMLRNSLYSAKQRIYVFNEANQLILSHDRGQGAPEELSAWLDESKGAQSVVLDGMRYVCMSVASDQYGWKYISLLPESVVYKTPGQMSALLICTLLAAIACSAAITYLSIRRNNAQVAAIANIIQCAENGDPLPEVRAPKQDDEFVWMAQSLVKTFVEQEYLKTKLSEHTYQLQAMELIALQAQMNPHFLLNTLKSIYWMSVSQTGKPNQLSLMVENLADMLSYSLQAPSRMVTFSEELRNARSYLEIQKIRYKDKIHVEWNVDDEALDCLTPKVLLQPLIENAIYHGVKQTGKGTIVISILKKENHIRLTVQDDGQGMTEEHLAQVRSQLEAYISDDTHIGLFNTNKRLFIAFGGEAKVSIDSKPDQGTQVTILIPLLSGDE